VSSKPARSSNGFRNSSSFGLSPSTVYFMQFIS
jgi:hypothetical protein